VGAHELGERGGLTAAVLATRSEPQDLAAEHQGSAPVARLPPERQVAGDASSCRAPDDVDTCAADHRDCIRSVSTGAQERKGVVVDRHVVSPAPAADRTLETGNVGWRIRPAEKEHAVVDGKIHARLGNERADHVGDGVGADGMCVRPRPAQRRNELALRRRDEQRSLRVATVDAEDQAHSGA
jgi:hypothetical protein